MEFLAYRCPPCWMEALLYSSGNQTSEWLLLLLTDAHIVRRKLSFIPVATKLLWMVAALIHVSIHFSSAIIILLIHCISLFSFMCIICIDVLYENLCLQFWILLFYCGVVLVAIFMELVLFWWIIELPNLFNCLIYKSNVFKRN